MEVAHRNHLRSVSKKSFTIRYIQVLPTMALFLNKNKNLASLIVTFACDCVSNFVNLVSPSKITKNRVSYHSRAIKSIFFSNRAYFSSQNDSLAKEEGSTKENGGCILICQGHVGVVLFFFFFHLYSV